MIRGDRRPDTAATDKNTALGLPVQDRATDRDGRIRIVHRISTISTDVQELVA
jgi:hypothetical protein